MKNWKENVLSYELKFVTEKRNALEKVSNNTFNAAMKTSDLSTNISHRRQPKD